MWWRWWKLKGVIEVEIFENGVIESLVVQPGQKVPVGATLATLSGEARKSRRPRQSRRRFHRAGGAREGEAALLKIPTAGGGTIRRLHFTLARKRAQEIA
jgi:pyruvate/2-oxoglutarate dehydrogenase complex dihydrolipoamide acyltransferase (E2) component